jgi:hypothetical protein
VLLRLFTKIKLNDGNNAFKSNMLSPPKKTSDEKPFLCLSWLNRNSEMKKSDTNSWRREELTQDYNGNY